jgi:hypothetical protein
LASVVLHYRDKWLTWQGRIILFRETDGTVSAQIKDLRQKEKAHLNCPTSA